MKKKKLRILLCALLALAGLTAAGAMAAGGAGSQSDPLVTLSYLTETFTGQVMDKVDRLIAERNSRLTAELGGSTSSVYAAVTLNAGQTLTGEEGCEVLLRSGAAVCAAAPSPGLVDTTTGGTLGGGAALEQNHLVIPNNAAVITGRLKCRYLPTHILPDAFAWGSESFFPRTS